MLVGYNIAAAGAGQTRVTQAVTTSCGSSAVVARVLEETSGAVTVVRVEVTTSGY